MRERKLLRHLLADTLKVRRDDREFLQRIRVQPRREIGLNGDVAWFAHLRDLGSEANHAGFEFYMGRLEPEDFASAKAGPDASE